MYSRVWGKRFYATKFVKRYPIFDKIVLNNKYLHIMNFSPIGFYYTIIRMGEHGQAWVGKLYSHYKRDLSYLYKYLSERD